MRRRSRCLDFTADKVSSDPFIKGCITRYAYNLMGKFEMNENYLWVLLRVLPEKQQQQLKTWMQSKKKKGKDNFYNASPYLSCTADMVEDSEEIWNDVTSGRVFSITRNEFKTQLFSIFKQRMITANVRKIKASPELVQLQKIFELNDCEKEIVGLLYCIHVLRHLKEMVPCNRITELLRIASLAIGVPFRRVKALLGAKSALRQKGIVVYCSDGENNVKFQLQNAVVDYLSGLSDVPLQERFIKAAKTSCYAVTSFNIPDAAAVIIRALLSADTPCNILLYGQPGTGKTEFAKAVIASAGKQPFFFQRNDEPHDGREKHEDELVNIRAAVNLVPVENGVLVVDEADSLLNTRYFTIGLKKTLDKAQLNTFLDEPAAKIIWITNDVSCIEESTLRRFAYSLNFKGFSRSDREHIWNELTRKHPLRRLITPVIRELAAGYPCNAAGIASALDTLQAVVPDSAPCPQTVKATLEELLRRHTEAMGRQPVSPLNLLTDRYDIDVLNLDTPPAPVIASLESFVQFRRDNRHKEGNVNFLFWGKPGTGKTELAKYLAEKLSLELVLKRASDLISMWVGQTEHHIREAFEAAERDNAILFIDEADSFFINRQTAHRSWEVSQTNELLTQMENHKGILICCTNLLEHLDKAVLRRFAWKINFRPLTDQGKLKVFGRFFPTASLSEEEGTRVMAIPGLTPGQMKAVWQKFRFVSVEAITPVTIIEALESEAQYENGTSKPIGFQIQS